ATGGGAERRGDLHRTVAAVAGAPRAPVRAVGDRRCRAAARGAFAAGHADSVPRARRRAGGVAVGGGPDAAPARPGGHAAPARRLRARPAGVAGPAGAVARTAQ